MYIIALTNIEGGVTINNAIAFLFTSLENIEEDTMIASINVVGYWS